MVYPQQSHGILDIRPSINNSLPLVLSGLETNGSSVGQLSNQREVRLIVHLTQFYPHDAMQELRDLILERDQHIVQIEPSLFDSPNSTIVSFTSYQQDQETSEYPIDCQDEIVDSLSLSDEITAAHSLDNFSQGSDSPYQPDVENFSLPHAPDGVPVDTVSESINISPTTEISSDTHKVRFL